MKRSYYSRKIRDFLTDSNHEILGKLIDESGFGSVVEQNSAWIEQMLILKESLKCIEGQVYFEYSIPRMGRRVDVVLIIQSVLFVLEFKVGQDIILQQDIDQVWDYALDLKNFHETSRDVLIVPILVPTKANITTTSLSFGLSDDKVLNPIISDSQLLRETIQKVLMFSADEDGINSSEWEQGRYKPTPTIIEAARALYNQHSVKDITRSDASSTNITETSEAIIDIIKKSREKSQKSICFVTGVPGAGKTLVGLNIATTNDDRADGIFSVYLSGNAPLVAVLREALIRDKVSREKEQGRKMTKIEAGRGVKAFIQNVHHFRDEYLSDDREPNDHVVLFDEAQRAWNKEKTKDFMKRKKKLPDFNQSEPEFLISCLDRHGDWAAIVCLVGGGQEIHNGEGGIDEWTAAVLRSFPNWHVYISGRLKDSEYQTGKTLEELDNQHRLHHNDKLHLATSMRSFRSEKVSLLVKQTLDISVDEARKTLDEIKEDYPIFLTRDIKKAKAWLKDKARGTERYGMLVSSNASRLKPYAIDVRPSVDPIHWFLEDKNDVRSSYYLEDVATEFQCQGLELDWACIAWDADFRYSDEGWGHHEFMADHWKTIRKEERKRYQKNSYRVLLTRARQGMVIVVPNGDENDHTRKSEYYDSTYEYLRSIGFPEI